ncbi:MAG: nitrous oxide-stimulated promoter family protein [FCB group bacterium]|jgi:hypothetical protein
MFIFKNRIQREKLTIKNMIILYCRYNHKTETLCNECKEIMDYAMNRLERCPFHDDKPTCLQCTVHCYREKEKQEVKEIMRFSGPKMLFSHPVMAVFHLIDNKKKHIYIR